MAMRSMALVLAVLLPACSSGAEDGDESQAPTAGATVAGLGAEIVQIGPPAEGAGEVPVFEWEPLAGATTYILAVRGAAGSAIWAWEGAETRVTLGGVDGRSTGEPGPVLEPGSSWTVAALDAEGHAIAISASRPVSP